MALVHPFSSTSIFSSKLLSTSSYSLSPPPTPPKDARFTRPLLPIYLTMASSLERTLSDEELDKEWESSQRATSPRPQSTMARSFSLALNDLFKIDSSIADLDAAVDQKKKAVSTQTSELEALEARLRATEERLRAVSVSSSSSPLPNRSSGRSSPRARAPLGDLFSARENTQNNIGSSPLASEFRPTSSSSARPKSRKEIEKEKEESYQTRGLPPTPGQSEGESSDSESGDAVEEERRVRGDGMHTLKA